ncbi:hypothetical protein DIPPA_16819 [Diplonema papillatum]|nr:hypothetical protein DIPPA_16819 [Diplonema papillatum]
MVTPQGKVYSKAGVYQIAQFFMPSDSAPGKPPLDGRIGSFTCPITGDTCSLQSLRKAYVM